MELIALAVCWIVLLGLAGLMPGLAPGVADWRGVRTFTAFSALLLFLFLAQLPLGIALEPAAWIVAVLAVPGLAVQAHRLLRTGTWGSAAHPVLVLPALALAVAAWRGGIAYEPLAWDEIGGWLSWMRQSVMAGNVLIPGDTTTYGARGYTPGWPFVLAFPNLLLGGIDESRSPAMFFLMHVALLGLAYDVTHSAFLGARWTSVSARLGAWAALLAALAAEATWRLVPTNLLIEEPQSYCLIACVFLAVAAGRPGNDIRRTGFHLGMAFAMGYLVKVSMLAFAGPLLLLFGGAALCRVRMDRLPWGEAAAGAVLMLAPILVVYGFWSLSAPASDCMSNPLLVARDILAQPELSGRAADLWRRFSAAEVDYLAAYKLPLTLLSLAGLLALLTSWRTAMVPVAFAGYVVLYFGALYGYHLQCFGEYYFQVLNSIDRFTRVPLRVMHFAGLVLLPVVLAPSLSRPSSSRPALLSLAAAVVALGGFQLWQINVSFERMATRSDATPGQVNVVRSIRAQTRAVATLTAARPELGGNVLQIVQGGEGFENVIADYYSIGHFRMGDSWSWGETQINPWMRPVQPEEAAATLLSASLVWPLRVDDWMMAILRDLVTPSACLETITEHLLIPDRSSRSLVCVPKPQPAKG